MHLKAMGSSVGRPHIRCVDPSLNCHVTSQEVCAIENAAVPRFDRTGNEGSCRPREVIPGFTQITVCVACSGVAQDIRRVQIECEICRNNPRKGRIAKQAKSPFGRVHYVFSAKSLSAVLYVLPFSANEYTRAIPQAC